MNKYFYFILLPLCLTLGACSSSSDDEEESPNESLSQEYKNFIGYWHTENGEYDFLFKEDGSCIAYASWDTAPKSGSWSYDNKSKTLSTTIGGNSWLINANSSSFWSGINMGSYTTVSYYPSDLHYFWRSCLTKYEWYQVDGDDTFSFSFDQVVYTTDSYIQLSGHDMSFIMGFYKPISFTFSDPRIVVDGFDTYPTYANMKIEKCKFAGDEFTATFSQTVEYNYSIAYHEVWLYNGVIYPGEIEYIWDESTDEATGLTMTVTDFDKSSPVITIEHAKSGYKATYNGFKK